MAGTYYFLNNFANFVIGNALAHIKASTQFGPIHLLWKKSQIYHQRVKIRPF